MVVLFSATTVAFWTHTGVAIRKSQHHDGLRTLLSCITEPKTERDRMRSNLWQTSKFFLAVSSSTLFKPKATIGVDMNKMVGYKAAESAFAPDRLLYSPPLLPQSALLNSIPIPENELVAELQAELESFVQLINPSSRQALQIKSNTSVLWNNLRTNAQRLAGMFLYNRKELTPVATPYDTTDAQQLRKVLVNKNINQMQLDVLRLVNASQRSSVSESLRFMRRSLNELCNIANLLVPFNETEATAAFAACVADQKFRDDDERSSGTILRPSRPPGFVNIPRLLGRATVILTFQRPGPDRIVPLSPSAVKGKADDDVVEGRVTLVVDGTNYPLTGGAFVDLCLKGYYDNLPVRSVPFEFDGEAVPRTVFGSEKFSYTDPLTGRPRRLPLEVLRDARTVAVKAAAAARAAAAAAASNNNSTSVSSAVSSLSSSSQTIQENYGSVARFTATGLARNSAVFTRAQPVLSFATVRFRFILLHVYTHIYIQTLLHLYRKTGKLFLILLLLLFSLLFSVPLMVVRSRSSVWIHRHDAFDRRRGR